MTDIVGLVLNTNGLSLAPAGDAEYIEIAKADEDEVIDAIISGDDEVPDGVAVVRRLSVVELVAAWDRR